MVEAQDANGDNAEKEKARNEAIRANKRIILRSYLIGISESRWSINVVQTC